MSALATLFDSNLWVALAFGSHPYHSLACKEFELADSLRPAIFCRATQHAFLRLITTPALHRIYQSPGITNEQAWQKWELLMALPQVSWFEEPAGMDRLWREYARLPSIRPKLWMDAYLAAFACSHGIPIST